MGTTSTLHTVTSKDGTKLVVDVAGSGPPIVLISGGSVDRGSNVGLEAVIELAGGTAHVYGTSSGAGLGLEAAAAGAPIDKLVLWEPPYNLDPAGRPPTDSVEQLDRMVAEGRRGDAATFFMTEMVRLPAEFVAFAKTQPWWAAQEARAPTHPQ